MNLLDPNFYESIPIWIYISGGFGLLFLLNSTILCCYCDRIRRKKELDLRELELQTREIIILERYNQIKKNQENNDIIISHPMTYSEYNLNRFQGL